MWRVVSISGKCEFKKMNFNLSFLQQAFTIKSMQI